MLVPPDAHDLSLEPLPGSYGEPTAIETSGRYLDFRFCERGCERLACGGQSPRPFRSDPKGYVMRSALCPPFRTRRFLATGAMLLVVTAASVAAMAQMPVRL